MKKSYFLTGAVIACLFINFAFTLPALKTKAFVKKGNLSKITNSPTIEAYLENGSSTSSAEIELTNTSGGPSYGYTIAPGQTQTNYIEPGTYTIKITDGGPGILHVERCASDLYGIPGMATPYTYTGYVTISGVHLVIVTD